MPRRLLLLAIPPFAAVLILAYAVASTPPAALPSASQVFARTPVPTKLLFIGDVMLDRAVASHAAQAGDSALFAGVAPLMQSEDAVIANLEGTITASSSVASESTLQFTFAPRFATLLRSLNVQAVSLSNNHADDFGPAGLRETKANLAGAGIAYFGSPANTAELATTLILGGKRVCLVGYEAFISPDPAPIAAAIAQLRPSCDYLAATMHAGVEYDPGIAAEQERAAHAFIDAGADAVFGTHPHVVEPLELYRGKPIFYSLGNYMFDQNFSWATTHGLAVEVALGMHGTAYTLVPITILHEEVSLSSEADAARTIVALSAGLPSAFASQLATQRSFALP